MPALRVGWDENKYVFWAESFGNIPIEDMVREGFRILKGKFQEFVSELELELSRGQAPSGGLPTEEEETTQATGGEELGTTEEGFIEE